VGTLLLVITDTFLYGSLLAWVTHWVMHQRWSGFAYRIHLHHHKLYPPSSLLADTYRDVGKSRRIEQSLGLLGVIHQFADTNSAILFVPAITLGFGLYALVLWALGVKLWLIGIAAAEVLTLGVAHEWLHTHFHLTKSWLRQFETFNRWQRLHFLHHRDTRANLGILWFAWDKLFGTYHG
jgi:sterol desaturase/sphingolipid hydroxylase (fatty acid hydroxylase superfamily)